MSAGGAGLLLLLLAQAAPVFRSGVAVVYVDVSVTRQDAPVRDLTVDDFVVTDNGVRQRVALVDRESTPTTAVLLLDASASVAGERLAQLRAAARAFLRGMAAGDAAALVTFNHETVRRVDPTTDRSAVAATLERVSAQGSTAVIDALYLCLKRRWGGPRTLVVLFTDGRDTASFLENDALLQAARESPALLYVVGSEAAGDSSEPGYMYLLQRAADITGGAYWSASFDRLEAVFVRVLEAADARYLLSYEPEGVAASGHHRLKVSVKRQGVKVRARQEYVVRGAAGEAPGRP